MKQIDRMKDHQNKINKMMLKGQKLDQYGPRWFYGSVLSITISLLIRFCRENIKNRVKIILKNLFTF